jgi:peptidoglycan/LPS O-acetylase OafA/YrhL
MKINYRPDIDGLRAIAVISVIFYHADNSFNNLKILPGGFIGVDIFFVISGFLITSIILRELNETGTFSFKNFYLRRLKRIIPVLLLVFISTFPFIWLFFVPTSFLDFSKSLISSLFFLSNYHFYFSGELYDAESSLLKPLMHTWSLSIEEQYYLIFPIILTVVFKFFRKNLFKVFVLLFLVSFVSMIFTFQKNESLAFFSFFARFWELILGGTTAILYYKKKNLYKFNDNIYSFLGLLLIFYSIFFYNDSTKSPYILTLLPVFGTSLVIYFNNKSGFIYKILSLKYLVFLGLISYSLYLWHYPVFAIGRTTEFFGDGVSKKLFIITFILSLISYFMIEKPIKTKKFNDYKIFTLIGFFYLLLILLSLASVNGKIKAVRGDILKNLFIGNETSNLTVCKDEKVNQDGYCVFNPKENRTLILIGDSHMQTLEKPLLEFSNKNKFKLVILNRSTCFYFLDLDVIIKNKLSNCTAKYQKERQKIILSQSNATVIMGGRTQHYLSGENFDNLEGGGDNTKVKGFFYKMYNDPINKQSNNNVLIYNSLNKTINDLQTNNIKVLLVYPIPEVGWNVSKKLITKLALSSEGLKGVFLSNPLTTSYKAFLERSNNIYKLYDNLDYENILRIYPERVLCNTLIKDRCITHDESNVFYIDDDHLSYDGAKLIVNKIKDALLF